MQRDPYRTQMATHPSLKEIIKGAYGDCWFLTKEVRPRHNEGVGKIEAISASVPGVPLHFLTFCCQLQSLMTRAALTRMISFRMLKAEDAKLPKPLNGSS